jgi:hypothetical protein
MEGFGWIAILLIVAILVLATTSMPTAYLDKNPTMIIYGLVGLTAFAFFILMFRRWKR